MVSISAESFNSQGIRSAETKTQSTTSLILCVAVERYENSDLVMCLMGPLKFQ